MTALLLPGLAVLGAVSITLSALAVGLPGTAYALGRLRRRARRAYTDWTLSRPEVPQPVPVPDTDREYLSIPPLVFPADVTMEELEQYAAAIEEAATRAEFAAIVREHFPYDRDKFPA